MGIYLIRHGDCDKYGLDNYDKEKKTANLTHGGAIRSIICGILNIPQERRFFFGYPPENCSISVIKFNAKDSKFYLHTFNDFTHLKF